MRPLSLSPSHASSSESCSDALSTLPLQTRGTWEDQQKMDQLRKAFQRAVQAPLNSVEMIWQDYNAFENNLSKMTVRRSSSFSFSTSRRCAELTRCDATCRPRSSSPSSRPPT